MRKPKQRKPLNDLSRSLTALDTNHTLIAVIEMGQKSWLVAGIVPGVERQPLKKLDTDENALLRLLDRWRLHRETFGLGRDGRVFAGPVDDPASGEAGDLGQRDIEADCMAREQAFGVAVGRDIDQSRGNRPGGRRRRIGTAVERCISQYSP